MAGLSRITVADLPPQYQAQVARKLQQVRKKESKYHNKKTEVNGVRFDSEKEATRYCQLTIYEKMGYIRNLRLQRDYTLQEAYIKEDGTRVRAIRYRADFTYQLTEKGAHGEMVLPEDTDFYRRWWKSGCGTIIEDVKGLKTDVYKIKKKLMDDHGLTIREV